MTDWIEAKQYEDITYHKAEGMARIAFNRPEVRNAVNGAVAAGLDAAVKRVESDLEVRVAILTSSQDKVFCAGADIGYMKRLASKSLPESFDDAKGLASLFYKLADFPTPVVAVVQGAAMGGGMGLAVCCDYVLAEESAQLATSEVLLGIVPGVISPYVIRAMGARAAHRYFLTAERFDAAEALRIGYVHEVVPAAELDAKVGAIAQALVQAGPEAVKACKQLVQDVAHHTISNTLVQRTVEGIADIRASEEGQEGIRSFLEKRKPNWILG